MNKVMKKFKNGEKIIGTLTHMKSAVAIEALGYTGADFVMIDMEHSPVSNDEIAKYLSSVTAAGLTSLIRVSEGSKEHILHMLDAGADGVIVPSIYTVDQVKEIIKYAKFMPVGERGYCMSRDGGWGFAPNSTEGLRTYMDNCNKNTLLFPQCETKECLEHIEEITALDGVDGILVGPFDLSIDMGIPGEFDNPLMINALKRIQEACRKNGKISVSFGGNTDAAAKALNDGYDAVVFGLDVVLYINMYKNSLKAIRDNIK